MRTRKKLWWSIGALAMVLVVAGTSVGVTIAALQAKVQSGFSISYTAHNVQLAIQGCYSVSPMSEDAVGAHSVQGAYLEGPDELGGFNGILFNGTEIAETKSFENPGEIELTASNVKGLNNFVLFEYKFLNFQTLPLKVDLNFSRTSDDENIKVEYAFVKFEQITEIFSDDYSSLDSQVQQTISENLQKINSYCSSKGLKTYLEIYEIAAMVNGSSVYAKELSAIKEDEETLRALVELVNTYETALGYSENFPDNAQIPYLGYSLEQIANGEAEYFYLSPNIMCLFIKISLKDETVNVDNFGATINFNLTTVTE